MTEKRFIVYDNSFSMHIIDNSLTEDKHEGNIYDIYEMCNKLNELNNIIECHKERISILSELLDVADAIIDLIGDDKAKDSWERKNAQVEQIWDELIKKGKCI